MNKPATPTAERKDIKAVRRRLLQIIGKHPSRLSQMITETVSTRGPMTRDEAVLLLAHETGINISKYVDSDMLARVRGIGAYPSMTVPLAVKRTPPPHLNKAEAVLAVKVPIDPIVPKHIAVRVREMGAEIYPVLYIFENSVRELVRRVMNNKYGSSWWDEKVDIKIQRRVASRQASEEDNPWHGKRGPHQVFYTDISDLKVIISDNWHAFRVFFPSKMWLEQRIDEINISRRVIAHNNPLSRDDAQRLLGYFKDWEKQLEAKRDIIPI